MQQDGRTSCTARAALAKVFESSSEGAASLARALCAHCEMCSPQSLAALEDAVRSYAEEFRLGREPPEKLVTALKRLFGRMDGHLPSLVSLRSFRDTSDIHPGCCTLYRSTLAQCIEAYFAELSPDSGK